MTSSLKRLNLLVADKTLQEIDYYILKYPDRFDSRTYFINSALRAYFQQLKRNGLFLSEDIKNFGDFHDQKDNI